MKKAEVVCFGFFYLGLLGNSILISFYRKIRAGCGLLPCGNPTVSYSYVDYFYQIADYYPDLIMHKDYYAFGQEMFEKPWDGEFPGRGKNPNPKKNRFQIFYRVKASWAFTWS
jgi:hypothetical protein